MYTAETLWAKFLEYMEYNSQQSWSKEDFIRSGPGAGTKVYIDTPNPASITGFALFAGMSKAGFDKMYETAKTRANEDELVSVITQIREEITQSQIDGASANIYNANIVARVTGLVDKKEMDVKTDLSDDERKDLIKKITDSVKKPKDDDLL